MAKDKYTAIWVSHTSIGDYLKCPKAYFLKNVYKDPSTGHKIQIMSPSLALGQAVHEVIDFLSDIPTKSRLAESPVLKFDLVWQNFMGEKGGFKNVEEEYKFKERGKAMLQRIMENPGPIANLAVKIQQELPHYWISEDENIVLCGKIDWLEYLKDSNSIHIIDFKTGKRREDNDSLQLPIYHLLVHHCQKRPVTKASYWYLEASDTPTEKILPDLKEAHMKVIEIGRRIKLARKLERFDCPEGKNGCIHCRSMDKIIKGEGILVGSNSQRDIYTLSIKETEIEEIDSIIL